VFTGDAADAGLLRAAADVSDNSNKFWQGKLNFTLAMAQAR